MSLRRALLTVLLALVLAACAAPVPAASVPPPTAPPTATPGGLLALPTFAPLATRTPVEPIATLATRGAPLTASTWTYVALGDSNPAGHGAAQSYVDIYASYIAADLGIQVETHNEAFFGATTASVLNVLNTRETVRDELRRADVVTLDVGYNDWETAVPAFHNHTCGGADNQDCLRELIAAFSEHYDGILSEVDALKAGQPRPLIRAVDMYITYGDVFVSLKDPATLEGILPYVARFNAEIDRLTRAHGGAVVHLNQAFNGPAGTDNPLAYVQSDETHLSEQGHQATAVLLRALGY